MWKRERGIRGIGCSTILPPHHTTLTTLSFQNLTNLTLHPVSCSSTTNKLQTTLYETFGKFGRVLNVDIKRDKFTGNNLGYGFIKMSTHEEAMAAKNQLDGTTLAGREMRIGWAQKNTTLFINELDGSISTDELRDIFGAYGPLVKYESFVCRSSGGRFGYVKYRHRTDAENAKASMHRKQVGTHLIRVGWGDNSIQKNCVHFQFTAHGAHITEEDVHKHFSTCGKVVSVNLPAYTDGQLKGFGFVHFDDSDPGYVHHCVLLCCLPSVVGVGYGVRLFGSVSLLIYCFLYFIYLFFFSFFFLFFFIIILYPPSIHPSHTRKKPNSQ